MKSVLIITLLVATAIAVPVKTFFPDPHPGYKGDYEIFVRETELPEELPSELQRIVDINGLSLKDEEDAIYIPLIEPDEYIKTRIVNDRLAFRDIKIASEDSDGFYIYLVSTTNDSKFKRYIYCDLQLNLYMKL